MIEHSHQPGFVKQEGNRHYDKPLQLPVYVMEDRETRRWLENPSKRHEYRAEIEAEVRRALRQPGWDDLKGLNVYTDEGDFLFFATREESEEGGGN